MRRQRGIIAPGKPNRNAQHIAVCSVGRILYVFVCSLFQVFSCSLRVFLTRKEVSSISAAIITMPAIADRM